MKLKLKIEKENEMTDINQVIAQALANGATECPEGVPAAQWEMAKAVYFSQINSQAQASTVAPAAVPATVPATLGAQNMPAAYTPQSTAFDIDSPSSAGLAGVSGYLKCKHKQTIVDDKVVNNDSFVAKIVIADVTKKLSIRGGTAGNIKYASTVDGITANDGTPWMQAIQNIQRIQPDARPYQSYDIPMMVCENLIQVTLNGNTPVTVPVAPKGTVLGHTTSITGKAGFEKLINDLKREGKKPSEETVFVRVTRKDQVKSSFSWAVYEFDLLSDAEAAPYMDVVAQ